MSAYLIVDLEITDPDVIQEYARQAPAVIQKYGGKYLVRGGAWEALEGDWRPKRVVVLEFPSVEQAKRWYDSDDYKKLKDMRLKAAKSNLILVEGV